MCSKVAYQGYFAIKKLANSAMQFAIYHAPLGSLANNLHNIGHLFISYPKPMEKRRWLWPACRAEAHCLSSEDKVLMWMLYECECWMWKRIDPSVKHYLKQNELSNRKYED